MRRKEGNISDAYVRKEMQRIAEVIVKEWLIKLKWG
jgi:hypothetical protein